MIISWIPKWYELDQCIVVGDEDLFYLSDNNQFADYFNKEACEVRAKINSIYHSQLGNVKGIITIGLDYTIYLEDGRVLFVNAEEEPGEIENDSLDIDEWKFDVDIKVVEKTGFTFDERMRIMKPSEKKELHNQLMKRYKSLLDISYAEWDTKA